ncbi:hypothetical protein RchiOBHm_Chr1g0332161 [Rosa chinensis]|uniref:Uncharacterized protein n=1 Tax=Rosa chinensis TaxID=74649 RepID=A0A2P6SBS6_ROSCH|nr:hypothetical protein RchiOBHm_Chr1g0332161 [Rosa chinensis]
MSLNHYVGVADTDGVLDCEKNSEIDRERDRELQSEGDIIHNDLRIERKRELQRVAGRKREVQEEAPGLFSKLHQSGLGHDKRQS